MKPAQWIKLEWREGTVDSVQEKISILLNLAFYLVMIMIVCFHGFKEKQLIVPSSWKKTKKNTNGVPYVSHTNIPTDFHSTTGMMAEMHLCSFMVNNGTLMIYFFLNF